MRQFSVSAICPLESARRRMDLSRSFTAWPHGGRVNLPRYLRFSLFFHFSSLSIGVPNQLRTRQTNRIQPPTAKIFGGLISVPNTLDRGMRVGQGSLRAICPYHHPLPLRNFSQMRRYRVAQYGRQVEIPPHVGK